MIIFDCHKCGRKVSDDEVTCPYCNAPLRYILNNENGVTRDITGVVKLIKNNDKSGALDRLKLITGLSIEDSKELLSVIIQENEKNENFDMAKVQELYSIKIKYEINMCEKKMEECNSKSKWPLLSIIILPILLIFLLLPNNSGNTDKQEYQTETMEKFIYQLMLEGMSRKEAEKIVEDMKEIDEDLTEWEDKNGK